LIEDLYRRLVLEHAKHPRHRGSLPAATHAATVDNPLCGDVVTLRLVVERDRIAAVAHDGHGCALSTAAASLLAERLVGLDVPAARSLAATFTAFVAAPAAAAVPLELGELAAFAGVRAFRARRDCATLPLRALLDALG